MIRVENKIKGNQNILSLNLDYNKYVSCRNKTYAVCGNRKTTIILCLSTVMRGFFPKGSSSISDER